MVTYIWLSLHAQPDALFTRLSGSHRVHGCAPPTILLVSYSHLLLVPLALLRHSRVHTFPLWRKFLRWGSILPTCDLLWLPKLQECFILALLYFMTKNILKIPIFCKDVFPLALTLSSWSSIWRWGIKAVLAEGKGQTKARGQMLYSRLWHSAALHLVNLPLTAGHFPQETAHTTWAC